MLMCMESVYVVGGCKLLAKGCSWLAVVHGYEVSFIPYQMLLLEKADVPLLLYAVFIRAYTACTKHCCVCSGGDCRIAVETSAFF